MLCSSEASNKVVASASYQTEFYPQITGMSVPNIGFFPCSCQGLVYSTENETTLVLKLHLEGSRILMHCEYAGMSSKRVIIMSMIISGALCGLGGTVEGLGTFQNVFIQKRFIGYRLERYGGCALASNPPIGIPFGRLSFITFIEE